MFRWDIQPPTDAILAAQRRGATVLLVGDDDLRPKTPKPQNPKTPKPHD